MTAPTADGAPGHPSRPVSSRAAARDLACDPRGWPRVTQIRSLVAVAPRDDKAVLGTGDCVSATADQTTSGCLHPERNQPQTPVRTPSSTCARVRLTSREACVTHLARPAHARCCKVLLDFHRSTPHPPDPEARRHRRRTSRRLQGGYAWTRFDVRRAAESTISARWSRATRILTPTSRCHRQSATCGP